MMVPRVVRASALVAVVVLGQSATTGAETQAYVATIQTSQGRYRAVIDDPVTLEKARREVAGEEAGIPVGRLAWGHGGVNRGHVWHVTDLEFADVTIELCDGTARMVDQDPVYWVETVRSFCPWSGQVVKLKPFDVRRPR